MYKGSQIKINLEKGLFMRESDNDWRKLPPPAYVAITQVKMTQTGGGRVARISHKYKAFCVYIKAGNLNILAYRGKRNDVVKEADRIAQYLNLEIKDLIPRNSDGEIEDDDANSSGCLTTFLISVVILIVLVIVISLIVTFFNS